MNGSNRETWIAIIHYEDLSKRHLLFKNFKCIRNNPFQDDCLILRGKHHDDISSSFSLQNKLTHVPLPSITAITMTAMHCQWPSAQLRRKLRTLWYPKSLRRRSEQADRRLHGISDAWLTGKFACQRCFYAFFPEVPMNSEVRSVIAADWTILCQFISRTTMGCHQHVILANRSNRQFSTKWCSRKTKGYPDMYN